MPAVQSYFLLGNAAMQRSLCRASSPIPQASCSSFRPAIRESQISSTTYICSIILPSHVNNLNFVGRAFYKAEKLALFVPPTQPRSHFIHRRAV